MEINRRRRKRSQGISSFVSNLNGTDTTDSIVDVEGTGFQSAMPTSSERNFSLYKLSLSDCSDSSESETK